ncbi:GNAT family N-acetyltransferase [Actinoplanes sp. NPDC051851]|uniref:GNAT family N-acetyltransferase n=1 Tax=Actinoplanes sp. NPDC051851 TaxID=3154753 RepID=UPI003420C5B4
MEQNVDIAITVATPADRERIVGSLVAAFPADPVLRHLFPDDETYPRYAAAFFGHLFDRRVGRGTIWTVDGVSAAIWEPPAGGSGDGSLADELPPEVYARVEAYDDAVHGALPDPPYWYLGLLGTHPEHAGRRLGRAVMAEGLARAAAEGVPAVLETSNPGNVEVYRRAGWEVVATVEHGPLTIWVMSQ